MEEAAGPTGDAGTVEVDIGGCCLVIADSALRGVGFGTKEAVWAALVRSTGDCG